MPRSYRRTQRRRHRHRHRHRHKRHTKYRSHSRRPRHERYTKKNKRKYFHRKCYISKQCAKDEVCDYTYIPKFPFGKRYGVGKGTCRHKRHANDKGNQCSIM